ncbi:MAG: hypothetical protein R3F54_28370 [Alphaproteobacteria bacterium]
MSHDEPIAEDRTGLLDASQMNSGLCCEAQQHFPEPLRFEGLQEKRKLMTRGLTRRVPAFRPADNNHRTIDAEMLANRQTRLDSGAARQMKIGDDRLQDLAIASVQQAQNGIGITADDDIEAPVPKQKRQSERARLIIVDHGYGGH